MKKTLTSFFIVASLLFSTVAANWYFIPTGGASYSLLTNGSTQWVTTADSVSETITNNITINIWVKYTSPGSPGAFIAKAESHAGSTNWGWAFSSKNGCSATGCFEILYSQDCLLSTQLAWYGSSTNIADGNWHMVTTSFASGTVKIYKDGVVDPSPQTIQNNSITTLCPSTGNGITVAGRFTNSSIFWPYAGSAYWPTVWNVVLSAAAITALYNSGTPHDPRVNSGSYSSSGNVALFFPMVAPPDSNTGSVADASGNSNTGTALGTPTFSGSLPH
jgi:hypothetical protein